MWRPLCLCFQNKMKTLLANQSFKKSSFCFVQFCSFENVILWIENCLRGPCKEQSLSSLSLFIFRIRREEKMLPRFHCFVLKTTKSEVKKQKTKSFSPLHEFWIYYSQVWALQEKKKQTHRARLALVLVTLLHVCACRNTTCSFSEFHHCFFPGGSQSSPGGWGRSRQGQRLAGFLPHILQRWEGKAMLGKAVVFSLGE